MGGTHRPVEAGVFIRSQADFDTLIKVVDGYLKEGYGRIKLKINPSKDYDWGKAVRDTFGDIVLQVDANSAYTLDDLPFLFQDRWWRMIPHTAAFLLNCFYS